MTPDTTLFTLSTNPAHPVSTSFLPGQFLQLSLPGVGEIPISYAGYPTTDGTIQLCIRHVGHVTIPLKKLIPNAQLAVRGPFGTGFPLNSYKGQNLILIAGGLGIAPIRSLLLAVIAEREKYGAVTLLYATKQGSLLLFMEELLEFKKNGIKMFFGVDTADSVSDNIPECHKALLPELLNHLEIDSKTTYAAICGPSIVYPYLLNNLQQSGIPDDRVHFSLERQMKCGIGRCGHCAVGTNLCCLDGPVFSATELAGVEGAFG